MDMGTQIRRRPLARAEAVPAAVTGKAKGLRQADPASHSIPCRGLAKQLILHPLSTHFGQVKNFVAGWQIDVIDKQHPMNLMR
jgi:hypothetical protein